MSRVDACRNAHAADILHTRQVCFVALDLGINTATPAGRQVNEQRTQIIAG